MTFVVALLLSASSTLFVDACDVAKASACSQALLPEITTAGQDVAKLCPVLKKIVACYPAECAAQAGAATATYETQIKNLCGGTGPAPAPAPAPTGCPEAALTKAIADAGADAATPCGALLTAAKTDAGATDAQKCACYTKVSATIIAPFGCKFSPKDTDSIKEQWAKCQESTGTCAPADIKAAVDAAKKQTCTDLAEAAAKGDTTTAQKCACFKDLADTAVANLKCKFDAKSSSTVYAEWAVCQTPTITTAPTAAPTASGDPNNAVSRGASLAVTGVLALLCLW
jgi:hypothetical protein